MRDLHVVLVSPETPWTRGNAGRPCLAAGATLHLVRPLGFSLDAKEVRRAGLDYWERVPLRLWESFEELDRALPELGEPFFVSPDAERTIWDVAYPDRTVLLFGSETTGLPAAIREGHGDRLLSRPPKKGAHPPLHLP